VVGIIVFLAAHRGREIGAHLTDTAAPGQPDPVAQPVPAGQPVSAAQADPVAPSAAPQEDGEAR